MHLLKWGVSYDSGMLFSKSSKKWPFTKLEVWEEFLNEADFINLAGSGSAQSY